MNIQITEDYVSFETAKLLKEKGFNESIETLIGPEGIVYHLDENSISRQKHSTISNYEINIYSENVSCPTHQMAMKWLREVHKIHVAIYPYGEYSCDNYQFDVYKDNNFVVSKDDGYTTYEEAVEAAIKYCLINLI